MLYELTVALRYSSNSSHIVTTEALSADAYMCEIGGAENAGVENAGATKYGKPSEENTLKYQTKYDCRGFHAYLLPNATHKRVGLLTLLLSSKQLGTPQQCIATHGAVSHAVALEVLRRCAI